MRNFKVFERQLAGPATPAATEIERLQAEVQALKTDARRYRALRRHPEWIGWDVDFLPDEIDREVDAMMSGICDYKL